MSTFNELIDFTRSTTGTYLDSVVYGEEVVTNGDFSDGTTGWSTSQTTEALQVVNGKLRVTEDGVADSSVARAYQQITTEVGKTYRATADIDPVNTPTCALNISNSVSTSESINVQTSSTATTAEFYFTAESTSTYVLLTVNSATTVGSYADFDNVSVKEAVADRSHNSKALQVVVTSGSILKDPVATGAELVSYKNFNFDGKYFEQPYNSDLDVISSGYTTPYTLMGWFKNTSQLIDGAVAGLSNDHSGATQHIKWSFDQGKPGAFVKNTTGVEVVSSTVIPLDTWAHVVWVNTGTNSFNIYIDGKFDTTITLDSAKFPTDISNRTLRIGFTGQQEMSLVRLSTSVPTPEQIAKIYRDEKPLFQEGAKCTLYGTVPYAAVLAYEEDKDLLHFGTASGRSVFKGLQRVSNTTDAITVALSAAADIVAGE